jgi:hypothetical protein
MIRTVLLTIIASLPAAGADIPCVEAVLVLPESDGAGGSEQSAAVPIIELPPRIPRDGHTLKSSAAIGVAYAGAFAIMWNMPEDSTNWQKDDMGQRFLDAFSQTPVWDDDEWATNWILHPWWGMWVYGTQRNYGESILRSFLVATAHSVFFEYFVEAWTEHPSAQDLISTSPLGALFGEMVHRWIKRMGKDGFSRGERFLIDLLNPAYRWQIGFDRPVQ